MKKIMLKSFDGLTLRCYLYEPEAKPKAAVLVVHGMQEHAFRYNDFCEFLVSKGYSVLAPDLRGHGHTAESMELLGYSKGDIFAESVEDLKVLVAWLKKSYSVPVFVFSHSYGSMLTQKLMQVSDIPQKYVLCGTANGEATLMKLANKLAKKFAAGRENEKATRVEKLSLMAYRKRFKNGNWLTRDDKVFEEYENDELCGKSFPYSFYVSLFSNLRDCNSGIDQIPDDKQIFLIAGMKDPVSQNGKQVKQLFKAYSKHGKSVQMMLFKDCRHELLNELNKKDIYNYILAFFEEWK